MREGDRAGRAEQEAQADHDEQREHRDGDAAAAHDDRDTGVAAARSASLPVARRLDLTGHLGLRRAPRRREVLVVAVEDDGVGVPEHRLEDRPVLGRCLGELGTLPEHDVVTVRGVLGDRQDVPGGVPGEPGADGVGVDPLAQQHRAGPWQDAARRLELRRREVVHAVVGDPRDGQRRAPGRRQAPGSERGIGGPAGVDVVAAAAPGERVDPGRTGGADRQQHGRQRHRAVAAAALLGEQWQVERRRLEPGGDGAVDRDASTGRDLPELDAVDVALAHQLACPVGDAALRVRELHPSDDDLERPGLQRLVGADDVERQVARPQRGSSGSV